MTLYCPIFSINMLLFELKLSLSVLVLLGIMTSSVKTKLYVADLKGGGGKLVSPLIVNFILINAIL
jgi:hypothetical protein